MVSIIYYSFSNQTFRATSAVEEALEELGIPFVKERLRPREELHFPVNSLIKTLILMIKTFFRWRVPIHPPKGILDGRVGEIVVLAGPTWSYNPSGPVLALLDQYGDAIFQGRVVIPVISCRSYWRHHYRYLRKHLESHGARVTQPLVLKHPSREPWKTIGVLLTISGKNPKRVPILKKHYKKYGHTKEQLAAFKGEFKALVESICPKNDLGR